MDDLKIGVIGLGYVGLPIAQALSQKFNTVGFDVDVSRVDELRVGIDRTGELSQHQLDTLIDCRFTSNPNDLEDVNFFIISVPTPITKAKTPDLSPISKASELVGRFLKKGNIVVYESTVYPGTTTEICVPILSEISGLTYKEDFKVGYSPERINPGDKSKTLKNITKLVSGCDASAVEVINFVYSEIVDNTFVTGSIEIAESAKVIENIQRDVNIALMNELSLIFQELKIPTKEVLKAAGTKWNFLPFEPGLVGGHCIGVDPYYLTYKAQEIGYIPELILAGRKLNENYPKIIVSQFVKQILKGFSTIKGRKILLCGLTFKENCPDVRNSKMIDIIYELEDYGFEVECYDPLADIEGLDESVVSKIVQNISFAGYAGVILGVKHDFIVRQVQQMIDSSTEPTVPLILDVKGVLNNHAKIMCL